MGFQLGPLAPLPGMQKPHPSPIQGVGLLAGQLWLRRAGCLSPLLTQFFFLLPLITLIEDWWGKK